MEITLPLPPKEVSPNARVHWAVKAKHVKAMRARACLFTMEAMPSKPRWEKAMASLTFYFKTNGRRDADNMLASCKAYFDGITDGGLLADDSGLGHYPVVMLKDKDNPRVEIKIEKMD